MAIEWTSMPAYGWGDGAAPADITAIWRRVYTNYDAAVNTMNLTQFTGQYANAGWYYADMRITSTSQRQFNSDIGGSYPSAWIKNYNDSAPTFPCTKTLITIVFPNAERRWSISSTTTRDGSGNCATTIQTKWFDLDGNAVNDVVDAGYAASASFDAASLAVGGLPGQWAVMHSGPGGEEMLYGFTAYGMRHEGQWWGDAYYYEGSGILIDIIKFAAYLQTNNPTMDFGVWEVETESPEAGPASGQGGYGGYGGDITASDSIPVPALPTASAAGLGFINMYNPSAGGLTSLGEEIFPDFEFTSIVDPTGNSVIDAILNACSAFVDVFNQVPKMFEIFINSRLIDYVQDCHIVPVAPTTGSPEHIKLGFRELDTAAPKITTEYVEVDLGTISITEFYKQFIDYLPYTRAKLFLPFVGFVPVEPEYWQSGSLGVVYHFNVYDGSFMAFVTASPNGKISQMSTSVIGQYSGNAIVHLPLTGLNYSSMVAGLVGGVGAASNAIAGGNVAAGLTAAINTATASPQVMSSNAYTASAAFMGCRTPFLIIERSVSHFPMNYQHDVGIPSKITTNLASASGFAVVTDIDLSGVTATDGEREEIRKLLAGGVYC